MAKVASCTARAAGCEGGVQGSRRATLLGTPVPLSDCTPTPGKWCSRRRLRGVLLTPLQQALAQAETLCAPRCQ